MVVMMFCGKCEDGIGRSTSEVDGGDSDEGSSDGCCRFNSGGGNCRGSGSIMKNNVCDRYGGRCASGVGAEQLWL